MDQSEPPVQVTYRVKRTPKLVFSIVGPYARDKLLEQLKAIAPISLFLLGFQFLVFRLLNIEHPFRVALGMCCVVVGLMFFIDGLRVGIMPLGENIGATLPAKAALWAILAVTCVLGTAANMAEPAINTLRILGAKISPQKAPLLFDYLNARTELVLLVLSIGVGIGACNGILRLVRGWSLKVTVVPALALASALTIVAALDRNASSLVGVAWDAGGITTGTVTAPLLLALGVGMSAALGKDKDGMAGFGIITLCSIWPVVLLLGMGLFHSWTGRFMSAAEGQALLDARAALGGPEVGEPNVLRRIGENLVAAAQAVIPLCAFLLVVQRLLLRERIRSIAQIVVGITFSLIGLLLFRIGLEEGLTPLGDLVGQSSVISFSDQGFAGVVPGLAPDGRYGRVWGRVLVLVFGFVAGYGATLAEPALSALGTTVEDVTAGAFKKALVMHSVGFGVGTGLTLGVARILFAWPVLWVVGPSYALALMATLLSREKYVNIAWDSGGVTTGDITSPVLIALGLGVGAAVGAPDSFSLIAMGSVWPIIAVLTVGIVVDKTTPFLRTQRSRDRAERTMGVTSSNGG